MTALADLPPDLLQLICRRSEAIELWKCGSKRLMARLANGGAHDIKLEDYHSTTTSRFPKCLLSFSNMRSLSIDRRTYKLMEPEDLSPLLQQLPPTLEKLILKFKGVEESFVAIENEGYYDVFGDEEQDPKPLSTSLSRNWSIKGAFPRLKTLILEDNRSRPTDWTKHEIADLPSTITHLRLPNYAGFPQDAYDFMPSSLQTLDAAENSTNFDEVTLLRLPRTLTSFSTRSQSYLEYLSSYPPSLTDLSSTMHSWTINASNRFSNFVTLCIFTIPLEYCTTYAYTFGGDWKQYTSEFLAALPRTLTRLELPSFSTEGVLFSALRLLPPTLTSLSLHSIFWDEGNPEFPRDVAGYANAVFPQIESLTIRLTSPQVLMHLPQSLIELSSSKCDSLSNDIVAFAERLPRNLTDLWLSEGCKWTTDAVKALPRSLRRLRLASSSFMAPAFAYLPPLLEKFDIGEFINGGDLERVGSLDRSGHYQFFDMSEEMEEYQALEGSDEFDADDDGGFDLFGDAPQYRSRRMVTKTRNKRKMREIVLPSAANGPYMLKSLQLSNQRLYTMESLLPSLPRTLTELALPFMLTGHQGLPAGLKVLHTHGYGDFSANDVDALPKSIVTLNMGFRSADKLPADLTPFLPPNMDAMLCLGLQAFAKDFFTQASKRRNQPLASPDPRVLQRFKRNAD